jgi:hypothetical protein
MAWLVAGPRCGLVALPGKVANDSGCLKFSGVMKKWLYQVGFGRMDGARAEHKGKMA